MTAPRLPLEPDPAVSQPTGQGVCGVPWCVSLAPCPIHGPRLALEFPCRLDMLYTAGQAEPLRLRKPASDTEIDAPVC